MNSRVYIGRIGRDVREKDVENFFKGYGRISNISLKEGFGFVNFEEARDAEDAVCDLNGKKLCGERVIIEHARQASDRKRSDGYGGGRGDRGDFRPRGGYGGYSRDGGFGRDGGHYGRDGGGRYGRDSGGRYRDNHSYEYRSRNAPIRTRHRVLVENLSTKICWQDLKDLMKKVGEVTFADAHKLREGNGIVEFASSSDVKKAIVQYDGYELEGKKIRVTDANRRNERRSRSDSGSRSRSGSRGRSRSGSRGDRDKRDDGDDRKREDEEEGEREKSEENRGRYEDSEDSRPAPDTEGSLRRKRDVGDEVEDGESRSPHSKYPRPHSESPPPGQDEQMQSNYIRNL